MNKVTIIKPEECAGWSVRDGEIRHDSGRFFSIVNMGGKPMIRQEEYGLLGFLFNLHRMDFLVHHKFEPGNVDGKRMITCSVQATQSNQERVHGGRGVHHLEFFTGHHLILGRECADAFLDKRNYNGIVTLGMPYPYIASRGSWDWVSSGHLLDLILHNNAVTSDAKQALVSSNWMTWLHAPNTRFTNSLNSIATSCPLVNMPRRLPEPSPVTSMDQFGDQLTFVQVETDEREVDSWCQPLLTGRTGVAELVYDDSGPVIWVGLTVCDGIFDVIGHDHDRVSRYCAIPVVRSVESCEEGGRFYRQITHSGPSLGHARVPPASDAHGNGHHLRIEVRHCHPHCPPQPMRKKTHQLIPLAKPAACKCGRPGIGKFLGGPVCAFCYPKDLANFRHSDPYTKKSRKHDGNHPDYSHGWKYLHKYFERFGEPSHAGMRIPISNHA